MGGLIFFAGWFFRGSTTKNIDTLSDILKKETPPPTPLAAYTFDNLSVNYNSETKIKTLKELESQEGYKSYLYEMKFQPNPNLDETKKVSGQLNIPEGNEKYPIVVMFRGYVDPSIYRTGIGTYRAAQYFAQNGFITISPDFLGYAQSDINSSDIFESRFQTYTTALATIKSVNQIDAWDGKNIFIWGHSNGGQIALIMLEILDDDYPTTLWAPVSKPFPFNILFYTDESQDKGKFLRKELAKFETIYDVDRYSVHNYFHKINAPIQIHQGTADEPVPLQWSQSLVNILRNSENNDHEATLYIYQEADHNLQPGWDTVVQRDLEFFRTYLK